MEGRKAQGHVAGDLGLSELSILSSIETRGLNHLRLSPGSSALSTVSPSSPRVWTRVPGALSDLLVRALRARGPDLQSLRSGPALLIGYLFSEGASRLHSQGRKQVPEDRAGSARQRSSAERTLLAHPGLGGRDNERYDWVPRNRRPQ